MSFWRRVSGMAVPGFEYPKGGRFNLPEEVPKVKAGAGECPVRANPKRQLTVAGWCEPS